MHVTARQGVGLWCWAYLHMLLLACAPHSCCLGCWLWGVLVAAAELDTQKSGAVHSAGLRACSCSPAHPVLWS